VKRAYPRRLARSAVAIGALIGGMLPPLGAAQAYTFKILHSFCARSDCADGKIPSGLIIDGSGNLYGTAVSGADGGGLIFELSPSADKKRWQYRVIHRFCVRSPDCLHGSSPSSLIAAASGTLFGTAGGGGAYASGVVFQLAPSGSKWLYTDLFDFCSQTGNRCSRGGNPFGLTYLGASSGALWDETSDLFGIASTRVWGGVAFTFLRDGSLWKEGAAYQLDSFFVRAILPVEGGTFYATLFRGPSRNGAIVEFRFHRPRMETVLYNFCPTGDPCTDGKSPYGQLAMDGSGRVYGTAQGGKYDRGVVYAIDPTSKQYSVIYNFCSLANCEDGYNPSSGVTSDGLGGLLGIAGDGGANDGGIIFKMIDVGGWSELVLHSFCSEANCEDGTFPNGPLVGDGRGNFFGTTGGGGAHGNFGTVYELIP
jgi:uncharacterized repeat protein (TIGR03803 family)